jgi:hypothetical protein
MRVRARHRENARTAAEAGATLKTTRDELDTLASPGRRNGTRRHANGTATPDTWQSKRRWRRRQRSSGEGCSPFRPANLEVIDTPEFLRGIYAVGGFGAAPPSSPGRGLSG